MSGYRELINELDALAKRINAMACETASDSAVMSGLEGIEVNEVALNLLRAQCDVTSASAHANRAAIYAERHEGGDDE